MTPYLHSKLEKNEAAANEVLKYLLKALPRPRNVVDFGCGLGAFLSVFRKSGTNHIVGIDGDWVDKKSLLIPESDFLIFNLGDSIELHQKFDWVFCLEVAEHLSEDCADTLIDNLTRHGDILIFSAATPLQSGQNHINEQPFDYWCKKFENLNYKVLDIFRKKAWNNAKIPWWYRQNLYVVTNNTGLIELYKDCIVHSDNYILYVHPDSLKSKVAANKNLQFNYDSILNGQASLSLYLGMLWKKIRNKAKNKLMKK